MDSYEIKLYLDLYREKSGIFRNKRLVLYGTGERAQLILNNSKNLNYVCVCDRDKTDGMFKDLQIVSIDNVHVFRPDIIVIASDIKYEYTIYKRIVDTCNKYNIDIYGVFLGQIKSIDHHVIGLKDNTTKQEIENAILNYDVISFDVFDTLVMRKCLFPTDVFDFVAKAAYDKGIKIHNFKKLRIFADLKHNGVGTLTEIYHTIREISGISIDDMNWLKNKEEDIDKILLIPRKEIIEIANYANSIGKTVICTSDMYHSSKFLKDILYKSGIDFDIPVYVSCEIKQKKTDFIFNAIKKEYSGKQIIHIGDNKVSDCLMSRAWGVDSIYISSGLELMYNSDKSCIGFCDSINDNNILGLFVAKVYNSPFQSIIQNHVHVSSLYDFYYVHVGPVITAFSFWIANEASLRVESDKIFFAARDGFILKQIYDDIAEYTRLPKSEYLYTSRSAAIRASIYNENDIDKWKAYLTKINACREGLSMQKLFGEEPIDEASKRKIIRLSHKYRENYLRYFNKLRIKENGKYLFVDLYSQGTIQHCLEKILQTNFIGLYYADYINALNDIPKIEAYYRDVAHSKYDFINIWNDDIVEMMEGSITSLEPSVDYIDNNGFPVFKQNNRSKKTLSNINIAQKAIFDYYLDFKRMYIYENHINRKIPLYLLNLYEKESVYINHHATIE